MNDLKFALRQLLKDSGFIAVAVLTLALPIGVTAKAATARSRGTNTQSFINGNPGIFAVEPQYLRSFENLNADQIIRRAVIEEHVFIGLDCSDLSPFLGEVNVSSVDFGIVRDLHNAFSARLVYAAARAEPIKCRFQTANRKSKI
jgi:hypothetical protein